MCDIQGCDEAPVYYDEQDNKLCQGCVTNEINDGNAQAEHFELISEFIEVDLSDNQPGPVTEITDAQVSIIPSIEDEQKLTVFVENLTKERLKKIQTEIDDLPVVTNKKTYDITFDKHQVLKKFRQLLKKSVVQKVKDKKETFENDKARLNKDHDTVLKVLTPMENQLAEKRKWWDMLIDAYKMNIADTQAKADKKEQLRKEKITAEFDAYDEKANREEKERLELEAKKLEREKYEFECIKTRLTREQSEIEAYRFNDCDEARHVAAVMNYDFDNEKLVTRSEEAKANNYKDCFSQDQLDIQLNRLNFDDAWEEAEKTTYKVGRGFYDEKFSIKREALELNPDMFATDVPAEDIDTKLNKIESDLDENVLSDLSEISEMTKGDSEIEINPEATPGDLDESILSDARPTQQAIDRIQTDINYLKLLILINPDHQKKLENFILSTEVNFNTFKKGTDGKT